ncbi:hypothetical protein B0A49_04984, partial [Cryomyces minteri]
MVRRSSRQSLRLKSTKTTPASPTARKRTLSKTANFVQQDGSSKGLNLVKKSKTTPNKSQHSPSESQDDQSEPSSASGSEAAIEDEASGYEDEDTSAVPSPSKSETDDDPEYSSEEQVKPKRSAKPKDRKAAALPKTTKDSDLWRTGVKSGMGPGTQVIFKRPKARPAGSTPYTADTVHPNTMLFLKDLRANNDREWLKMHDPDYCASLSDFNSFVECLTQKVVEVDDTIPELPVKDIVFRIYRDIRFSPDQTPYKTYVSAAWSRTGRKGPYAAYYVQVQPGGSFVGGGLWMPEAQSLAALRRDIDRNPQKIKRTLVNSRLRKEFFGGIPDDEKKAVKAFVAQNAENALKTKPKGYDSGHKNIELLRLRNFTVGKKLEDEEVIGSKGLARVAELISCMVPF